MPDFTVVQVHHDQTNHFALKNGPNAGKAMVSYKLNVTDGGPPQTVELVQIPTTPAPVEGDVIPGYIEQGQYGPKLKKDRQGGGQNSSSTGGYSGGGRGGKSDAEQAAIRAQSARRDAIELFKLVAPGPVEGEGVVAYLDTHLKPIVEWCAALVPEEAPATQAQAAQPATSAHNAPDAHAAAQQQFAAAAAAAPEKITPALAVELLNRVEGLPAQAVRIALIAAGVHDTGPIEDAVKNLTPQAATEFSSFLDTALAEAAQA